MRTGFGYGDGVECRERSCCFGVGWENCHEGGYEKEFGTVEGQSSGLSGWLLWLFGEGAGIDCDTGWDQLLRWEL